jgi:hypothetical protein
MLSDFLLRVISGHASTHQRMSALPLKADIAQYRRLRPLSAKKQNSETPMKGAPEQVKQCPSGALSYELITMTE